MGEMTKGYLGFNSLNGRPQIEVQGAFRTEDGNLWGPMDVYETTKFMVTSGRESRLTLASLQYRVFKDNGLVTLRIQPLNPNGEPNAPTRFEGIVGGQGFVMSKKD